VLPFTVTSIAGGSVQAVYSGAAPSFLGLPITSTFNDGTLSFIGCDPDAEYFWRPVTVTGFDDNTVIAYVNLCITITCHEAAGAVPAKIDFHVDLEGHVEGTNSTDHNGCGCCIRVVNSLPDPIEINSALNCHTPQTFTWANRDNADCTNPPSMLNDATGILTLGF
jgi:hypothetical protein